MAKEESKKVKKSKSKAAAKTGSAAAAPDARAVVVASIAAFLEAGGFPRALSALQSEANLEVFQLLASVACVWTLYCHFDVLLTWQFGGSRCF